MSIFLSIGSGAGIGFATASLFAEKGFKTILTARTKQNLEVMTQQLRNQDFDAHYEILDASDPIAIQRCIDKIIMQYGPIDVLHYNAASMREQSLAEQPIETFVSDLSVNIGGALAAIKTLVPYMEKRGKGTILLTGGSFAFNPSADFLSLSIGKSGIRTLALALFEGLKEKNIHLTTVNVLANLNGDVAIAKEIASACWAIHHSQKEDWTAEVNYLK